MIQVFIECSQCMDDVYNKINDYNPTWQKKILIGFDDMMLRLWLIKDFIS